MESNPYYCRLTQSGYDRKVPAPTYLEPLLLLKPLLNAQGLHPEDASKMNELEKKLRTLINGGYVGTPRKQGL